MYSKDTEEQITITVHQGLICLLLPEQWSNGKQVRLALGLPDTSSRRFNSSTNRVRLCQRAVERVEALPKS